MIIYLGQLSPAASSNLPEARGPRQRFSLVLLRMGFTCALSVTRKAVVSYTALPPLPIKLAVYFCCTFLGVASTGRYPASCPVKSGLSSPIKIGAIIYPTYIYLLNMKCAATDKFPQNRITSNFFRGNRKKVIQKFQKPFCLSIFRGTFFNLKQQRLCI